MDQHYFLAGKVGIQGGVGFQFGQLTAIGQAGGGDKLASGGAAEGELGGVRRDVG